MKNAKKIVAVAAMGCLFGLEGCDPTGQIAILQGELCSFADSLGEEIDGFPVPDFCH